MQIGRAEIFTDVTEITSQNIREVLLDAYTKHTANAIEIDGLLNYEAGNQPLPRTKEIRPDINIQSVDNVAHEITAFNQGFIWGNPITIVQRGEKDSGKTSEIDAISLLNEGYSAEGIKAKTQKLSRFVEIGGVGYTFVDVKREHTDGDSYFSVEVLDPRWAFVVRSSRYIDHRILMGVSFSENNGTLYFSCFTKDNVYQVNNFKVKNEKTGDVEEDVWNLSTPIGKNVLGEVPIVEWVRSYDRMGCFERFKEELDTLNLMISDFSNDVDQNTQAIWHGNDLDFPTDENGKPKTPQSKEWVLTETTQDGKQPFIKPLTIAYDYTGMLNNIASRRAWILEKANVPGSTDKTNGATGVAMDDALGWSKAETAANAQQGIMEAAKMNEIRLVLKAISVSPFIESDNPMLSLRYMDVEPNVKRMKTYEMVTKSNAFATYVSHGVYGLHALTAINAFSDVNQVWEDSKEMIEKYQDSLFNKNESAEPVGGLDEKAPNADRLQGDESDQIDNSPTIDKQ